MTHREEACTKLEMGGCSISGSWMW